VELNIPTGILGYYYYNAQDWKVHYRNIFGPTAVS
jgi:hypothetical protein